MEILSCPYCPKARFVNRKSHDRSAGHITSLYLEKYSIVISPIDIKKTHSNYYFVELSSASRLLLPDGSMVAITPENNPVIAAFGGCKKDI